jgi:hypothetical protein
VSKLMTPVKIIMFKIKFVQPATQDTLLICNRDVFNKHQRKTQIHFAPNGMITCVLNAQREVHLINTACVSLSTHIAGPLTTHQANAKDVTVDMFYKTVSVYLRYKRR